MKTKSVISVLLYFIATSVNSQFLGTGVTTDPRIPKDVKTNAYYNTEWKKNKFLWFLQDVNDLGNNVYPVAHKSASNLYSPFDAVDCPSYISPICKQTGIPDMYPEDGWELIKQDLGFQNLDTYTKNGVVNTGSGLSVITSSAYSYAYVILYNKFKSTLRILGAYDAGSSNYIKIQLAFDDAHNAGTDPNNPNNGSGLFAFYPRNGAIQTLDMSSGSVSKIVQTVALPATNTGNDSWHMFYADFQLAYDPCTCILNSGLKVEFYPFQQGSINLAGVGQQNVSAEAAPDFLASVWTDNAGNVQSGLVNYKSTDDMISKFTTLAAQYYQEGGEESDLGAQIVDGFSQILGFAASIALLAREEADAPPAQQNSASEKLSNGFDAISKLIDFGSFVANANSGSMPTALTSFIALSGKVDFINQPDAVTFSTPGSPAALSYAGTEFPGNTNANYPLYNNPLGTFAMLKKPTVNRYLAHPQDPNNNYVGSYRKRFICQLPINPDNIKYTFNPAIKINKFKILAAFHIEERNYDIVAQESKVSTWGVTKTNLKRLSANKTPNIYYDNVYTSPLVPLECLEEVVPAILYTCPVDETGVDCDETLPDYKIFLKLVVVAEYNQLNKLGNNNTSVLFLKVPLTVNDISDTTVFSSRAQDEQDDIFITGTNPSLQSVISGWNNINIQDASINNSSRITITAGEEIVVSGESSISGEVTLQNGYPVSCKNKILPIGYNADLSLDQTGWNNIKSFCQGQAPANFTPYTANQYASKLQASSNISDNIILSKANLSAHPNPLWTSTTFYYKVSEKGSVKLYLTNGLGQKVAEVLSNATHEAGEFEIEYTNTTLPSGMYLIVLETESIKESIRLAIVR